MLSSKGRFDYKVSDDPSQRELSLEQESGHGQHSKVGHRGKPLTGLRLMTTEVTTDKAQHS